MENSWLSMAKRLQAIATTGNTYVQDKFDRERYNEVSAIALQMMADLSQKPVEVMADLTHLYSVRHKSKGAYIPDVIDFYKMFFLCRIKGDPAVSPGMETSGAAYFELEDLPPLSTRRTIEGDLLAAWAFKNNTGQATYFE